jgi:lysozyme
MISKAGLDLIKASEGLRLRAYRDTGGVLTIGYGHTGDVKEGDEITEHQADVLIEHDVSAAEKGVEQYTPGLSQHRFDACVSLAFNVGAHEFGKSTLARLIRAGDFNAAAKQFDRWIYDDGKVQSGLVKRRYAERKLFQTPDFSDVESGVASTAPTSGNA